MVLNKIADKINECLNGIDSESMFQLMVKHYQIFQLLDNQMNWVHPQLQKKSDELLGKNWTENRTKSFVWEMTELAQKNEYLVNFLEQVGSERFETLTEKFKEEGTYVIPDLLAFAIVLERLSIQMAQDPEFIILLTNIFRERKNKAQVFRHPSFFHKVKLLSIEAGLLKKLEMHKTGVVPPGAFRWLLPLNILEAYLFDFLKGNKDNAKACLPLVVNRAGAAKEDPLTGAGPSIWSEDKKTIRIRMSLPKEWANLYQTWNMAFVSQYPSFLYLLPKLIIPQVANYHNKPTEFIENRVLALYLTLLYTGFLNPAKERNNEPVYNWSDKKLTTLWGKANLVSANLYKKELGIIREQTNNHKEITNV